LLDTDFDLYLSGGSGWKNYAAFVAQVSNTPEWGAELMDLHFDPVVLRLIGLLKQALPDCPEEDVFWGYRFITGALIHTLARTGRIDHLSKGPCKSDDFAAVKQRMAAFMGQRIPGVLRRARQPSIRAKLSQTELLLPRRDIPQPS
jgi:hypothetical protein